MQVGYPIVLNIRDRRIVVVGGGNVALRKVRGLLESGATDLTVISPAFHPEMPLSQIKRVAEPYSAAHLAGAMLVFAVTDSPWVNDQVVQDGHAIGALVCRADVDEEHAGDFVTPAMIRRGPVLVTVSTGGNPALSALVRDRVAQAVDVRYVAMADAMRELRPIIRQLPNPLERAEVFRTLCTEEAVDQLHSGGMPGLKRWLRERFEVLKQLKD